jgi:hypothetical protein
LAVERQAAWAVGELAWWRRLAGIGEQVTGASAPYAAQLAGAEDTAVETRARHGCPYDAGEMSVVASMLLSLVHDTGETPCERHD